MLVLDCTVGQAPRQRHESGSDAELVEVERMMNHSRSAGDRGKRIDDDPPGIRLSRSVINFAKETSLSGSDGHCALYGGIEAARRNCALVARRLGRVSDGKQLGRRGELIEKETLILEKMQTVSGRWQ